MALPLPFSGNYRGDPRGDPKKEVVIECVADTCPLSRHQYVNACAPNTNTGEGGEDRHELRIGNAPGWKIIRPPQYLGRGKITNEPKLLARRITLVIDETADP